MTKPRRMGVLSVFSVKEIPVLLKIPTGKGLRILENEEVHIEYYLREGMVYITEFVTPYSRERRK